MMIPENLTKEEALTWVVDRLREELEAWKRVASMPCLLERGYIAYLQGLALRYEKPLLSPVILDPRSVNIAGQCSLWTLEECKRVCTRHAADYRPLHINNLVATRIAELTQTIHEITS